MRLGIEPITSLFKASTLTITPPRRFISFSHDTAVKLISWG